MNASPFFNSGKRIAVVKNEVKGYRKYLFVKMVVLLLPFMLTNKTVIVTVLFAKKSLRMRDLKRSSYFYFRKCILDIMCNIIHKALMEIT